MARIAILEGFEGRRKKRRRKRKHLSGHKSLFGKVAKVCLTSGGSKSQRSKCMSLGLREGLKAAQKYAKKI